MWIEKKEKEFFRAHHVAYQQPSTITPTTLEFLNVIFLFCLHSLYERNFCLLPSFLEPCSFFPYPLHCSHLSNATSLSITSWPILEHLVFSLSFSLSFSHSLSFPFSFLSFTSFSCIRAVVRTSLRTFMIPRCAFSILLLCRACLSFLSRSVQLRL